MKRKSMLPVLLLGSSLSASTPTPSSQSLTKKALIHTLAPQNGAKMATSERFTSSECDFVNAKMLEGTPFSLTKSMTRLNATHLLGKNQASPILHSFNPALKSSEFEEQLQQGIQFPLIYPGLRKYFPQKLEDLCSEIDLSNYDLTAPHILIIARVQGGNSALAYYQRGELKLATQVSLGLRNTTIEGQYLLNHSAIYRRSKKYQNAPMPYAIHITGGYFMHQGWSDGKDRSHGCVRVPGLYQKWLYQKLPKSEEKQIIIYKPYEVSLR